MLNFSTNYPGFDCLFNFFSNLWPYNSCTELRFAWMYSALASVAVISAGVFPAFLLSGSSSLANKTNLNRLLSFSVGSLLGDVFLHLLPECWTSQNGTYCGLLVILGLTLCFLIEKSCATDTEDQRKLAAYMNLVGNFLDNFTHGLAVGGSFRAGVKVGMITTLCILIHEIPHEIGDFAILLRAKYSRWVAVRAQLMTAVGGVLGATFALVTTGPAVDTASAMSTNWILPFTAGGFLNIALIQVLPELIEEESPKESAIHCALIVVGAAIMGLLNLTL